MDNNLLFIVSSLKNGGPINHLWGLLSNKFFATNVTILSLSPLNFPGSRKNDFEMLGVKLCSLNYEGNNFYKISKRILAFIEGNSFSKIISQGFRSDIAVAKISKKLPAKPYAILHNYIYHDYLHTYGKIRAIFMTFLHVRALKVFNVISVSESVRDFVFDEYSIKSIAIRNGVSLSPLLHDIYCDGEKRKVFRLIYVGVMDKRKNVVKLIESFNKVKRNDIELFLVGDGPLKEEIQSIKDKRIHYLGQRSDVNELLLNSDIFLSASTFEGLPMAALEAIASGVPCILSNISPHQEIIGLSSSFGCVVNYDNCDLSSCIDKMIAMDKRDIQSDFLRLLSSDIMAQHYAGILLKR